MENKRKDKGKKKRKRKILKILDFEGKIKVVASIKMFENTPEI